MKIIIDLNTNTIYKDLEPTDTPEQKVVNGDILNKITHTLSRGLMDIYYETNIIEGSGVNHYINRAIERCL